MSRRRNGRRRTGRRPVTRFERAQFIAVLAAKAGQSPAEAAEHIRRAVEAGWLIETRDGWQAAIPAAEAPADWTGPVA